MSIFRRIVRFLLIVFLLAGHTKIYAAQGESEHEILTNNYGVMTVKISNIKDQPSSYCSPKYIKPLFDKLVDKEGPIKKILLKIIEENHNGLEGYVRGRGVEDIDPPTDRNTVLYDFFRGGANGAGATYHSFLTYISEGSGAETHPVLELAFSVSAEQADDNMESVIVTTALTGWRELTPSPNGPFPNSGASGILNFKSQ